MAGGTPDWRGDRQVLVVGVHPKLAIRALRDGRGLAVVAVVGVGADDQPHELEAQPGLVECQLQLAQGTRFVQAGVHQHNAVARGDGVGVAVRNAGPGQRQAQAPQAGQHTVGPGELPFPCRHGSIRTPGLRMPAGSTAFLAAPSAAAKRSGRWRSYHCRWSRPTA